MADAENRVPLEGADIADKHLEDMKAQDQIDAGSINATEEYTDANTTFSKLIWQSFGFTPL